MVQSTQNPYISALQWHVDAGADEVWQDTPNDRTAAAREILKSSSLLDSPPSNPPARGGRSSSTATANNNPPPRAGGLGGESNVISPTELLGTAQARIEAAKLAASCNTLEELRSAMQSFDGLAIKKTATQMVFSDGNPAARVMLIGEAPGADEDKQGQPFVGVSGQLLDKIFAAIGLSRKEEDPAKALYISNIINWRPPGNRTPSPAEIDISLPFIERHIALAAPKVIVLCGGVSAKGLLGSGESISKLRGKLHDYKPMTQGISNNPSSIPAIATYHPAYLLRTPSQKKMVWADMLMLRAYLEQNYPS